MHKRTFVALLCLLLLGTLAIAQVRTIKLRGGGKITGTVRQTKDGYEVTTPFGVVMTVPLDKVVSIEDAAASTTDEYLEKLKKIDPDDADARYALGEWAFRRGLYKIAAGELRTAKKLRKDFDRADLLLKQVLVQMRSASSSTSVRPPRPARARTRPVRDKMLSPRDINRLRLSEVQRREQVRVMFRKKALDRFIKSMRSSDDFRNDREFEKRFRRMPPYLQLDYILDRVDQGDWKLKDDILIKNDPRVFREFRRKVWPLISKGCAATTCHGAPKGKGRLKLFGRAVTDDPAAYTNFLILDMYARGGNRMIYRDHAELSLLLDYGLPRTEAKSRHPKEIMPIYKSVNGPKYRTVKEWISSLQGPPHPNYNTDFKPPFGPGQPSWMLETLPGATTKPAGENTGEGARPM